MGFESQFISDTIYFWNAVFIKLPRKYWLHPSAVRFEGLDFPENQESSAKSDNKHFQTWYSFFLGPEVFTKYVVEEELEM